MSNELRALLERITGNSHQDSLRAIGELRALLDAPVLPADATHYWPKEPTNRKWRKKVGGEWCEWCGGAWLPLDHQIEDQYVPVPPAGGEPLIHITPAVLSMLRGEVKTTPGGITFSLSEPIGGWTVPLYEQHVVTRLQAELADRKAKHHRSCQLAIGKSQLAKERHAEIIRLQAELDALKAAQGEPVADAQRKDAERYRWLRERDLETLHRGGVFAGQTPQNMVLNGKDLDDAIDAAMGKQVAP